MGSNRQIPQRTALDDAEQYLETVATRAATAAAVPPPPLALIRRLIEHGRSIERQREKLANRVRELESELGRERP